MLPYLLHYVPPHLIILLMTTGEYGVREAIAAVNLYRLSLLYNNPN